jgi:hypothetical protein
MVISHYPSATDRVLALAESPQIPLPMDYLPKEASWWGGVIINDPCVVAAVVSVAQSHFAGR